MIQNYIYHLKFKLSPTSINIHSSKVSPIAFCFYYLIDLYISHGELYVNLSLHN